LRAEIRIGSTIAPLFFNNYGLIGGASCYLTENGIDQIGPFLPTLKILIEQGPMPFTAILTMNLLEVSPRAAHTAFLLSSALIWLRREPTNTPLWSMRDLALEWRGGLRALSVWIQLSDHPSIRSGPKATLYLHARCRSAWQTPIASRHSSPALPNPAS
jgi:hypothetical protein